MSPGPTDALRVVSDLPEATYAWFAEHARPLPLAVGDRLFGVGPPADERMVVLSGATQLLLDVGGQPVPTGSASTPGASNSARSWPRSGSSRPGWRTS